MKISLLALKEGSSTGSSECCISFSILCTIMIKFMQKCQKFNLRTCGTEGLDSHSPFKITRTKASGDILREGVCGDVCFLQSIPLVLLLLLG